jgi:hypothetical protein
MMTHKILGSFVTVLALVFLFQVSPGVSADHIVRNIVLAPDTPNILAFDQHLTITFDYSTIERGYSGGSIYKRRADQRNDYLRVYLLSYWYRLW